MLYPSKVADALEVKREKLTKSEESRLDDIKALEQTLGTVAGLSLVDVTSRLSTFPYPGAWPTAEHDFHKRIVIAFSHRWSNHRQARRWALKVLQGTTTFAVDGSQIPPARDISIPIAVTQAGWFENPHQGSESYVKDVAVEVLTPDELSGGRQAGLFPNWQVDWQRFKMEVERLVIYMQAQTDAEPRPLCFFDGSLVVSFAQHMRPDHQRLYTDAVVRLLDVSEQTRVPVVGYIDYPYTDDLVTMLGHLCRLHLAGQVTDAGLLRSRMKWGDRTQVYICARDDEIVDKYYDRVCFAYLKTTADNPPARLEFPRWMYEAGIHKRVLDLVRAECVVGTGYPYPLETADALAVLTMEDRERFYKIFQEFAEREGLTLRFPRKAVSKRRRRT